MNIVTLGIGTPAELSHFILLGLEPADALFLLDAALTDGANMALALTDGALTELALTDGANTALTLTDAART